MKKILIYTMIMTRGGTEKLVANLSNYFINFYDIVVVTNINHPCEYELNPKIKFYSIDSTDKYKENKLSKIISKLSHERTNKLKKIIEKESPNIVLSLLPEPTIRALALKKEFPNISFIFSIRNHPNKEFKNPLFKLIRNYYYKKADSIVIQDILYKKYFKKDIQNKMEVIPNYVACSDKNVNIKKEKIIMTATRLEKQKNVSLLIKAFSKLDPKFDSYKLYIYGNGSFKNKLIKIIKKMKLENRVFLKGTSNSIEKELQKATLFVLPSNYEGMPNVLLEALSNGLPVITTLSTEVIPSIVDNNVNGIIVEKNNPKILTEKIEYLLENEQVRKNMEKEAIKIKEKFSLTILKKWEQIFKKNM